MDGLVMTTDRRGDPPAVPSFSRVAAAPATADIPAAPFWPILIFASALPEFRRLGRHA
jgi:hypothetical protein